MSSFDPMNLPGPKELQQLPAEDKRRLLEALLKQQAQGPHPHGEPAITALMDEESLPDRFPMSIGQQGVWHAYRRDPNRTPFNVFLPSLIRGQLDLQTLRQAIDAIAKRHRCLRTTFAEEQGELVQRVDGDSLPEFRVIDARHTSHAQIQEEVLSETMRPFDLHHGPLLRLIVFQRADNEFVVLAMTHHIVVDYWSLMLILQEVRTIYTDLMAGRHPELPAIPGDYSEFVGFQQSWLQSSAGSASLEHWQRQIDGVAHVLELPHDRRRPSVFTGQAESLPIPFSRSAGDRVDALAAHLKATSFSVIHAAIQVMLSRYTRQEAFLIGSPFSGRSHQRFARTVGFFINMLPVRADLQAAATFTDLVQQTQQNLVAALSHEACPFSEIVRQAGVPRDPSRSPLFQVSFTFEQTQVKEETGRAGFLFPESSQTRDFSGLEERSFYIPHPTCHYDLEFIMEQTETGLQGMLVYCRDLFDQATMRAFCENFSDLLDALLTHPRRRLTEIHWPRSSYSTPPVLTEQHDRPGAAVVECTVPSLILQAARQHPHRVALQQGVHSLTYAELVEHGERLAFELDGGKASDDEGANNAPAAAVEERIPVVESRGMHAFIGMLAVQLSGRVPIPVDSDQPPFKWRALLDDTQATRFVSSAPRVRAFSDGDDSKPSSFGTHPGQYHPATTAQQLPRIWECEQEDLSDERKISVGPMLTIRPSETHETQHAAEAEKSAESGGLPDQRDFLSHCSSDQLAYIVYTSGSTGKPKGVMIDHAAVCNTMLWRMQAVPLATNDRVLATLTHQFDAGLGVGWTTLTQGAALVWPDQATLRDPERLINFVIDERITVLPVVPSLLRILAGRPRFADCRSLRMVWTGGEPLPEDLPAQVRRSLPVDVWNFYGPSEAAIEATAYRATEHAADRTMTIGKPIANTQVHIVDEQLRSVPPTVPGQIVIAGRGLARGYLNHPELTEQHFVRDANSGQRWYLTGDLGLQSPDGSIRFLGRHDHQVKLRGYRIELEEIEAVLEAHYEVARAAVILVQPETPHAHLVAYFSLEPRRVAQSAISREQAAISEAGPSAGQHREKIAEIRKYLARELPPYKVPTAYGLLDTLPLTSSGKVDRRWLAKNARAERAEPLIKPPRTPLEHYLADAWAEALGDEASEEAIEATRHFGINQDFFQVGGSSLQAALLTSKLSEDLQVPVPTALLFDLADIESMARTLAETYPQQLSPRFDPLLPHSRPASVSHALTKHLSEKSPSRHSAAALVVALKPSGSRSPWFLTHPPGGIVACYRDLAEHLTARQPLFAIRSRGLHGDEPLPASLEQMAEEYVAAIRAVQPHGPYTLGGWSLGGLIAYEMSQQLIAAGESIERLLLLDTSIPRGASDQVPVEEQVEVGQEYGIDLTLEQFGALPPEQQLPFLWEHANKLGVITDNTPPEVVDRVLHDLRGLFHHHVELASAYRLEPIDCRLELYRPQQTPVAWAGGQDRGWCYLSNDVHVRFTPGHHHSMVQPPYVAKLAQSIAASQAACNC